MPNALGRRSRLEDREISPGDTLWVIRLILPPLTNSCPRPTTISFSKSFPGQWRPNIAAIGCALLLARQASREPSWLIRQEAQHATHPKACADLAILLHFVKVIGVFIAFILVSIAFIIADHFNWPRNELYAVGIILIALTLTRLFTDKMKNRFWARILLIAIWVYAFLLASLTLFNFIGFWQRFLQGVDFQSGKCTFPS